jgi:hypothetical protein
MMGTRLGNFGTSPFCYFNSPAPLDKLPALSAIGVTIMAPIARTKGFYSYEVHTASMPGSDSREDISSRLAPLSKLLAGSQLELFWRCLSDS